MERQNEGIGTILKDLRDETRTLVKEEVALARAEVREKVEVVTRNLVWIGLGVALLLAGLFELLLVVDRGLVAALAQGLPLGVAVWLAPLIVALILLPVGWFALNKGKTALREETRPEETIESAQKTGRWAMRRVRGERQRRTV